VGNLTYGSLFAGIGGIDKGMDNAGFQCKWQCEIDEFASSVLSKHWPNVDRYKDVRQFPPRCESPWLLHRWKEQFGVDVVCAGFPCTDVSYAGKGAGLDGKQSGLFFEVIRVASMLRPRAILLENVSALLTRGLDRVCVALAQIGYMCEWESVQASEAKAPHRRDRVFIVAYPECEGLQRLSENDRISKPKKTAFPVRRNSSLESWLQMVANKCDIRSGDGIPLVLERHRIKALGNAVVPQVAEVVAEYLMKKLAERSISNHEPCV
jgi:DNA (cytosine-5)-methyltransferase 1